MNPPLSRRQVLIAGASVALAPAVRYAHALAPDDGFAFCFFSDTHVGLKTNIELNRQMLAEIAAWRPDFAINGGDVTDYGWVEEYRNYQALIDPLPFRVYHNPGNHDVRWSPLGPKAFREGTRSPLYTSFDHKGAHFAILDSTVPLSHYGHFESEMLRWLEADLKRVGRETPVFIATHHWIGRDKMVADNEHALLKVIEPYNVKLVFNGHGHSDLLWTWDGLVNTMNKGLYQLSWQKVEVDRKTGEVRLLRRSERNPEPKLVTTVPLSPLREKRQVYALGAPGTELRLGEGTWVPNTAESVAALVPGQHRLFFRKEKNSFFSGPIHEVKGPGPRELWRTPLSGGVMSHLALHGGTLYVSAMDGSVRAVDPRSGRVRWTAKTKGYCHSSPVTDGRLVVVGSADNGVYAFDTRTGKTRWRFETGGPVYASAALAKGLAIIASGDGKVYGLDLQTGRERWRYALPPSNTAFVQSPAATDGERVYLGAWDKFLYTLDAATGKEIWRAQCTEKSFAYSPAIGQPVAGEGKVFVPSNDNQMHAFDGATGAVLWKATAPADKFGYPSPAYADGIVYSGGLGEKGHVHALSARDGSFLWTAETGQTIYDSGVALGPDYVAIGSVSGLLSIIGRQDGKLRAQRQLPPGLFLSTCVADGRRVYAATYNDTLMGLEV
jgi:outer membrane protein assembly factor BamB